MSNIKNLLPSLCDWKTEDDEIKHLAKYSNDNNSLSITIDSNSYGLGKWITEIPVSEEKTYYFSVSAEAENSKLNDIYALYTISDEKSKWLIREHIPECKQNGSNHEFYGKIHIPSGGVKLKIELWLKGYVCHVSWKEPLLCECEPNTPRNVRVALAYISPKQLPKTLEKNKETILTAVDNAGKNAPDIIVLSEAMYDRGCGLNLKEGSETDNGTMCTLLREKARKYNSYIIYNFHEKDGLDYFNTSILIDRAGNTVGKYRKTHLTVVEFEEGMTPGNSYPVFETDFGRIGILICYDHYFSATSEYVAENGAEIVFVSSAGDSEEKLSARAMDTGLYFAVCGLNNENSHGWGAARVVAPNGDIIAQTSEHLGCAVCDIDLSSPVRRHWLSVGPAYSEFKNIYRYEKVR